MRVTCGRSHPRVLDAQCMGLKSRIWVWRSLAVHLGSFFSLLLFYEVV